MVKKESSFELVLLSIIYLVSSISSFILILLLKKSFSNISTNLLILMIIILAIVDLLTSFSASAYRISLIFVNPLAIEDDPTADVFSLLAFLWGFGLRMTILIPFFFSLSIYLELEFDIKRNNYRVIKVYLMILVFISFLWALVPLIFDGYGINEDEMLTIVKPSLIFLSFYLPLIFLIFFIIGLIIRSKYLVHKLIIRLNYLVNDNQIAEITKFIYFPLVIIICYFLGIIRRFMNILDKDDIYLRFGMNALIGMQGLFNTIYCIFMTVRTRESFLQMFLCLNEGKSEIYNNNEHNENSNEENLMGLESNLKIELNHI